MPSRFVGSYPKSVTRQRPLILEVGRDELEGPLDRRKHKNQLEQPQLQVMERHSRTRSCRGSSRQFRPAKPSSRRLRTLSMRSRAPLHERLGSCPGYGHEFWVDKRSVGWSRVYRKPRIPTRLQARIPGEEQALERTPEERK